MKEIVFSAMLIAIGAIGLAQADNIQHLYAGPAETVEKRQVVERCGITNAAYSRLSDAERENCYARMRAGPPSIQVLGPLSVPKEDVRRTQALRRVDRVPGPLAAVGSRR